LAISTKTYAYYEAQRAGLGEAFSSAVEACIAGIRRNPQLYPTILRDYRRALVRRFPYLVVYRYADQTATVYAIVHTSRDPETWRWRLN
jgi:plasmid stabilization system protein ParE